MSDALKKGRQLSSRLSPNLGAILSDRFDDLVPDFAESPIEWGYGRHYARSGLDLKTRQLCTIAALTVPGGQTGPQLKINIEHTLVAGASRTRDRRSDLADGSLWGFAGGNQRVERGT